MRLPFTPIAALAVAGLAAAGCLPGDTRPEPGMLVVTVAPSDATKNGFVTSDGWTITFDRFLTAVGDVDLDPDPDGADTSCNDYSETNYERLFDFTVAGEERVGVVYGLGTCSLEYRMRAPSDDVVLGTGADEDVAQLMRIEQPDAYTDGARVAVAAIGSATKDGVTKTFSWPFRRGYEVDRCAATAGEGYASVFRLRGGEEKTITLEVRAEELFRRAPIDEAPLVFDSYAAADLDANGEITLTELALVPASTEDGWTPEPPEDPNDFDPDELEMPPETLADTVYAFSVRRVTRVAGGASCESRLRGGFRGGFGGF